MGIPKSVIDAFPPHVQQQIRKQLANKTCVNMHSAKNRVPL